MTTENEHAADDEARGAAEDAEKAGSAAPFNLVEPITVGETEAAAEVEREQVAMLETAQLDVVETHAEWTVVNWQEPDTPAGEGSADAGQANEGQADLDQAKEDSANEEPANEGPAAASGDASEPGDAASGTEVTAGTEGSDASAAPQRDLRLGQQTAEGLATMTPVAMQTEAADRDYGDTILQISDVSKSFGSKRALNEVSYGIRQGSFSGLVGPNGAGKTTLLNIISGLLPPTKGTVTVAGIDVWKSRREAAQRIGVLPDRLRMFEHLTGAQYLAYVGSIRGLNRAQTLERTDALIDQFELRSSANRLVTDYSAGMRKKLALAATLIHAPQLLILDEPFETIDPVSASVLIDVLIDYADRGGTVLLSSHSMDLVQRTCDHVVVIAAGEVLAEGSVEQVRDGITLEERFRSLVRGPEQSTGLDWLEISFG